MEVLYRPMAVLIDQPWLGAIPGAVFLWLWIRSRRRLVLAAALAWLLYLPYEYGMKWRVLRPGECNIRPGGQGPEPREAGPSAPRQSRALDGCPSTLGGGARGVNVGAGC